MSYVYIKTEQYLWTVGFYKPDGTWEPESDHSTRFEAANRVAMLNGSPNFDDLIDKVIERIKLMNEEHEAERRHS